MGKYSEQSDYKGHETEDDCVCCPVGLVMATDDCGKQIGCVTPKDFEQINVSQTDCKEGYVKVLHPLTGEFVACLLPEESRTMLSYLLAPTSMYVQSTQTNVKCKGSSTGTAGVNVSGGTGPYAYLWSNGAITAVVSGLAAGTYSVTITDATPETKVLIIIITEPTLALSATEVVTNETSVGANDGTIILNVVGGIAPYTYLWGHGPVTKDVNGLAPGSYSVVITDFNGCTVTKAAIVVV